MEGEGNKTQESSQQTASKWRARYLTLPVVQVLASGTYSIPY